LLLANREQAGKGVERQYYLRGRQVLKWRNEVIRSFGSQATYGIGEDNVGGIKTILGGGVRKTDRPARGDAGKSNGKIR